MHFNHQCIGIFFFLSLLLILSGCQTVFPVTSSRESLPLTTWSFTEDRTTTGSEATAQPPQQADWQQVHVPHVFRQSGLPDNASGWYRQVIELTDADKTRNIYLSLEGAASVKDVFVNKQHVGQHKGPFSAAAFDLTPALKVGQNTLDVRVSNRDFEVQDCLARSTLYYVNGGMFRKAWLVKTGAVHIFPDMGSSGVYLTPTNITTSSADLKVQTVVYNALSSPVRVMVRHVVFDPKNTVCAQFSETQDIPTGGKTTLSATGKVAHPVPWDLGKPNLYTVRTEVYVNGKVSDSITERVGFRRIEFKDKRFYLNEREVQFRGVNKHEQNEYDWNAVDDDEARHEWQGMADMGVNSVRLAHYPHSRLEYDIADERGIAVWAENGYAGQAWEKTGSEKKNATLDGERLTREMVRQNWNHPSILFWSAGNEAYINVVSKYADVIRSEKDATRLITYAAVGDGGAPKNCDFVARNTYNGWYGANGHYSEFSKIPLNALVSETGSGNWITHHVPYGTMQWTVDKYEPEEYAEMFAEYRLQTVCRNNAPNHPMFFWWTYREFYDVKFKGNRNTKGLLTLAGMPKDTAFLFQAFFNPNKPLVHLCGRHHFLRTFAPDNGIKAYSNAAELQLTINGVPQGAMKNGSYRLPDSEIKKKDRTVTPIPGMAVENVFFWKTPLQPGRNVIEVSDGKGHSDRMVIYQKTAGQPFPTDPTALVQDVQSSNVKNPAVFIDRPVEAQGPMYTDVDGSSDNTFDLIPKEAEGAAWIATRRLSDPALKTDLSFRINPSSKGATVFALFSTGSYPTVTLKQPNANIEHAANALRKSLATAGFKTVRTDAIWRDHSLNRANAELWSRTVRPGEKLELPGQPLDYVVLMKEIK